jgi:hypothetical protein
VAVCVLPGTELSFAGEVASLPAGLLRWRDRVINHKMAIFRQINKEKVAAHHDAVELPDGQIVLLTVLRDGQQATVLQCRPSQRLRLNLRPNSGRPTSVDRCRPAGIGALRVPHRANFNLIPVAVVRDIQQAIPVSGNFVGMTDAFAGMSLEVLVTS